MNFIINRRPCNPPTKIGTS
uniref:Uncharacterized protein n=1 Tax=Arundo donax TaxID=35708 RepID=A0A0A8ZG87_ARUDO